MLFRSCSLALSVLTHSADSRLRLIKVGQHLNVALSLSLSLSLSLAALAWWWWCPCLVMVLVTVQWPLCLLQSLPESVFASLCASFNLPYNTGPLGFCQFVRLMKCRSSIVSTQNFLVQSTEAIWLSWVSHYVIPFFTINVQNTSFDLMLSFASFCYSPLSSFSKKINNIWIWLLLSLCCLSMLLLLLLFVLFLQKQPFLLLYVFGTFFSVQNLNFVCDILQEWEIYPAVFNTCCN